MSPFHDNMRRIVLTSALAILLAALLSGPAMAQGTNAPQDKGMYPFETALLKYDEELSHADRERVVYIADWGNKQREDVIRSRFGERFTITTMYLGDEVYRIDWQDKKINKVEFPEERQVLSIGFKDLADKLGSEEEAGKRLISKGWYVLPEEPVLGYFCEVWKEYDGKYATTYWAYNGVALRKIVKYRDTISTSNPNNPNSYDTDAISFRRRTEARKAQFNVYLEDELFELPKDFERTDEEISDGDLRPEPLPPIRQP